MTYFIPEGHITATVSHSSGGNGFDGPRKEVTREVQLPSHYTKRHGRNPNTVHAYEAGDFVRAGVAKGWYIDSIS